MDHKMINYYFLIKSMFLIVQCDFLNGSLDDHQTIYVYK